MKRKMLWRNYQVNQDVKYKGTVLTITTNGAVYQKDENGSLRALDSIWITKTQTLCTCLLDGTSLRIRKLKEGLKVIGSGE